MITNRDDNLTRKGFDFFYAKRKKPIVMRTIINYSSDHKKIVMEKEDFRKKTLLYRKDYLRNIS